jgi:hypothetical protein
VRERVIPPSAPAGHLPHLREASADKTPKCPKKHIQNAPLTFLV